MKEHTNRLIHESSPYLLQHAHNPVDWFPWGEEALAKAQAENKLLLISIGYSACHWCHVMERESFEDATVASIMNEHFVCIKVDREERPDIDDIYMTACQLSSGGSCGWPLNSFALPDGKPVWAGTYFPKARWTEILQYFEKTYREEPEKMQAYANQLVSGVSDIGLMLPGAETPAVSGASVDTLATILMERTDPLNGGRMGSPKFPMPNNWQFLLHYSFDRGNPRAKRLALTTLDKMMNGGLYDPLEGGFARYSTDSIWLVPHFEKMLYDNGQLLSLYANAYSWTKDENYLNVITKTTSFVAEKWTSPEGGFYSAFDADSEGEEGKYYTWTTRELEALLEDQITRDAFFLYYDIRPEGNWEDGKNILYRHLPVRSICKQLNITESELINRVRDAEAILLNVRKNRIQPGLDDKILTAWNGLMLQGIVDAYKATGNESYKLLALRNALFIEKYLIQQDGRLARNYKDGKSMINGFLDDYAFTIQSFLSLYEITFDKKWFDHAVALTSYLMQHFSDSSDPLFFYTSDIDPPLVARRKEFTDNVIPSANSMMARNLMKLGTLTDDQVMKDHALSMFQRIWPNLIQDNSPSFYSNWCQFMIQFQKSPIEVVIMGSDFTDKLQVLQRNYLPDVFWSGSSQEEWLPLMEYKHIDNQTNIYVCRNKVCKLPTGDVGKALQLLNGH